jgi:heme/copper-type cytochrome/quinol oxidase subunit 1
MNALTIRCIRAAFVFMAAGLLLGATFAIDRSLGASLRLLHAELNLWGGVTMLIYGMAYHMVPRFAGRPLRSAWLAEAQSWLAIGGVALVSCGLIAQAIGLSLAIILLIAGATLKTMAAMIFAWQIGDLLRLRRI